MLFVVLLVMGCQKKKPPAPVLVGVDPAKVEALEAENRRLAQEVDDQQGMLKEKDALISRMQLQLLERDARAQALMDQMATQQGMLDEAVVEVVRTKAKLRSIESRAEAASTIAEAEIALKGLKESITVAGGEPGEEYGKANALLRMSTNEFKKENYGGALYLAGQAQSHIRAIQGNLSRLGDYALNPGEVLFAQPLPLKVLKKSNLRQGPSLDFAVQRTLEAGTLIVGYSYMESWVRVHTEDGEKGWIYQNLIGER
jgi:hypothetical protein